MAPAFRPSHVVVFVVMLPLAEHRPADADDRGALLDRDLEVVGHAHRQIGAEPACRTAQPLGQLAQAANVGACLPVGRPAGRRSSARGPRGAAAPARRSSAAVEVVARSPTLAGSPSTLTWRRTGSARRAGPRRRAGPAAGRASTESTDWMLEHLERATGLVRLEGTHQVPAPRPGPRPTLASASWTRFSPSAQPGGDGGAQPSTGPSWTRRQGSRGRVAPDARTRRRCARGRPLGRRRRLTERSPRR